MTLSSASIPYPDRRKTFLERDYSDDCRPCLGLLATAAARPTGTGADGKSNMAGALDRLGSLGRYEDRWFDAELTCANRRRCAYSRNA